MELKLVRVVFTTIVMLLLQGGDVQAQTLTLAVSAQNIAENSAAGTTVETLVGNGGTGAYTFTLLTSSTNFGITGADLLVLGTATLDFETAPLTYTLEIQIVDSAGTPVTSTATFTVTETDADDPPVFASTVGYAIEVVDGTVAGTTVGTVTATDPDATPDIASYSITGTTFTVSTTGVISVATGQTVNALPYLLTYEARGGAQTGTTTIAIVGPFCSSATTNSIGIMAVVTTLVFQAMKYL